MTNEDQAVDERPVLAPANNQPEVAPPQAWAMIEPGRYQAHLRFEMAGDWVILLHVTLPGGEKLERLIDVRGVRPN